MRTKLTILFLILLAFGVFYGKGQSASVDVPDDCDSDDVDDLEDCINKLEKKISELQGKERTLENEINSLNDQIGLIQLKIQTAVKNIADKEAELVTLTDDIFTLSGKIELLGEKVSYQTVLLNERIKSRYKTQQVSPLQLIFGGDLSEIVQKIQFLKTIEEQDNELIIALKETKKNYEIQKKTLEDKKAQVELLKASIVREKANLEGYRATLNSQRSQKDTLLAQTQGDEATYQQLLASAKAEMDAIEGIVSGINFKNGEDVDEGEVIAVMGNSGYPNCSSGPHLHFEVRKNGAIVNAESYLESKTLYVSDYSSGYKSIGSGDWSWPLKGAQITQRYGKTPWSWRYASGKHTGIDMVSSNTLIYAPEDGKFVKGTTGCYGSSMNYAAIQHDNGVVSYYFHIK